MSQESPSWSDEEDQPWDTSDIEFGDEEFQADAPVQDEAPIPSVKAPEELDSVTESSETKKLEANENIISEDLHKNIEENGSTKTHEGLMDGSLDNPVNSTKDQTKENGALSNKSQIQNKAQQSENLIEKSEIEVSNPSFVDSNVLDTSDEEAQDLAQETPQKEVPSSNDVDETNNESNNVSVAEEETVVSEMANGVENQVTMNEAEETADTLISAAPSEPTEKPETHKEDGIEIESSINQSASQNEINESNPVDEPEAYPSVEETSEIEKDYAAEYESYSKTDLIDRIAELELQLRDTEDDRDATKNQLEDILNKIRKMKLVFEEFKVTKEELEVVKSSLAQAYEDLSESEARAAEIEQELDRVTEQNAQLIDENADLAAEKTRYADQFTNLNNQLSDLNSECDRLSQQLSAMQREYQAREDTLQDEKYTLENEVSKLNKRLSEQKAAFNELEVAKEEVTITLRNLELVIEELRGSLQDKERIIEEHKVRETDASVLSKTQLDELHGKLEEGQKQIEALQREIEQLQENNKELSLQQELLVSEVERYKKENERIASLEEDVQSKQVIIGKLRHEAIILNEHLTKSLSMLRKQLNEGESSVDKELVSNLFINFLQLPRGDTKKFEALQLISSFLNWDDLRKVLAGLTSRGAVERGDEPRPSRLSFITLWTDFLDKESSK